MRLMALTGNNGIDVILDMVGRRISAATWIYWRSADDWCRLPCCAAPKQSSILVRLLRQRITVTGSTLRSDRWRRRARLRLQWNTPVWPLVELKKSVRSSTPRFR